jgi:hypothetical protein
VLLGIDRNRVESKNGKLSVSVERDTIFRGPDAVGNIGTAEQRITKAALSSSGRYIAAVSSDNMARIWRLYPETQELVDRVRYLVPRCLSPHQREEAFFDPPDPPPWCIEMRKWPYNTEEWSSWLAAKKAGNNPPVPGTSEQ